MRTVLYCADYDAAEVESAMHLPADTTTVYNLGELRSELECHDKKPFVVFALDTFDQRVAKLAKGLESAKYEVQVVSFNDDTIYEYREYVMGAIRLFKTEFGPFFCGDDRTTNKQLNRLSFSGTFGTDKYRVLYSLASGEPPVSAKHEEAPVVRVQKNSLSKKKKPKKIDISREAPVPVVEDPIDLTRKTSSGNWTWATEAFKSLFSGSNNKQSQVVMDTLSMEGLANEDSQLDGVMIETDTSRFDYKVYTTPMECLMDTGAISQSKYNRLVEVRDNAAVEKGVQMSLEDFAILTKAAKESEVLDAMRRVYHTDFLSYKRLMGMKVLTNVFPKAVCKKYRFIHVGENPRVLVSTMGNRLTANLGSHFGDAQILFSLQSIILARLNAVEEWEHEGGSMS